ncbi:MAG: hypothetical protein ACOX75_01770 [Lachnospiraceae bacterium]|jgi:hypothetical protein
MKAKKIIGITSLALILIIGVLVMIYTNKNVPITYDGSDTDAAALLKEPSNYDVSDPDGIADIIVKQNLEKTNSYNSIASVVFDFRGFDTLGESFILLTAIAGSFVILAGNKKSKKKEGDKK